MAVVMVGSILTRDVETGGTCSPTQYFALVSQYVAVHFVRQHYQSNCH
jgi:hypothetical protein